MSLKFPFRVKVLNCISSQHHIGQVNYIIRIFKTSLDSSFWLFYIQVTISNEFGQTFVNIWLLICKNLQIFNSESRVSLDEQMEKSFVGSNVNIPRLSNPFTLSKSHRLVGSFGRYNGTKMYLILNRLNISNKYYMVILKFSDNFCRLHEVGQLVCFFFFVSIPEQLTRKFSRTTYYIWITFLGQYH